MSYPAKTERDKEFAKLLGQAIRAARTQQGMKQIVLAMEIGVKQHSISQWEHGSTTPTWPLLQDTAKALGLHLWQLIRVVEVTLWKRQAVQQAKGVFTQGVRVDPNADLEASE